MARSKSLFLKLAKLSAPDRRETKLQITLDPLTSSELDLYLVAYEKSYREKQKTEAIVAAIIREYLESDRAFNAYKRNHSVAPSDPETPIE